MQIDRRCGPGLQAVIDAAMRVQTGAAELVLAGGAESMSQAEFCVTGMRWVRAPALELVDRLAYGRITAGRLHHPVACGMIETAENLRREFEISRDAQDQLAVTSHRRAIVSQEAGRFADEIVPVAVPQRRGEPRMVERDEHPRADVTPETLAALRPVRVGADPEATVTAGNASGQNDGAAVCIVTHPDLAKELGLEPLARLVSWAVAGVPPAMMGLGPVPATAKARSGVPA